MKIEQSILRPFCRTAICIISILFISIGFSFGGALANSCQGGADCLVCAELPHGHVPGGAADMENPACPPDGQNSTCGFETGQNPDEFDGIASFIRPYNEASSGIITAAVDQYGQFHLSKGFFSEFLLPDSDGATPIYLQNQSLLL